MTFPPDLVPNIGGLGVLALVVWLLYRQRNQDAASLLAGALERVAKLESKVAGLEERERIHATVLQRHAAWDSRASALLQTLDPAQAHTLGEPPPLYPPQEG